MRSYRTEVAILLEILGALDPEAATIAGLSRRVNVPYRRLEEYIDLLQQRQLIQAVADNGNPERATRFRVTDEGRKFMTEARQFEWLLRSYGIRL
jgi:predicted transcriptional regulator